MTLRSRRKDIIPLKLKFSLKNKGKLKISIRTILTSGQKYLSPDFIPKSNIIYLSNYS
jgi:hypothetical protein